MSMFSWIGTDQSANPNPKHLVDYQMWCLVEVFRAARVSSRASLESITRGQPSREPRTCVKMVHSEVVLTTGLGRGEK